MRGSDEDNGRIVNEGIRMDRALAQQLQRGDEMAAAPPAAGAEPAGSHDGANNRPGSSTDAAPAAPHADVHLEDDDMNEPNTQPQAQTAGDIAEAHRPQQELHGNMDVDMACMLATLGVEDIKVKKLVSEVYSPP